VQVREGGDGVKVGDAMLELGARGEVEAMDDRVGSHPKFC
jgi:hypothetical protein